MITQNSQNGKVAYDFQATSEEVAAKLARYNEIAFQTYTGISFIEDKSDKSDKSGKSGKSDKKWIEVKDYTSRTHTKDEVRDYSNGIRGRAKNWERNSYRFPTERGLNILIDVLNRGVPVHFCITHKSCGHEDVDYADSCFADYDVIGKDGTVKQGAATLEELLSLPTIQKYCIFYQASSSGLPNCHFQFAYEKSHNFSDHTLLLKYLVSQLNDELQAIDKGRFFDTSLEKNSTHVCYAGKTDCVLIERTPGLDNEYGDLIPASWIQEARDLDFKAFREDKEDKNLAPKIIPHNTPTESSPLSHIYTQLIDKFGGDWTEFYNLMDHQWKPSSRTIPEDAIGQVDGQNPFSSTNSSGESFSITAFSDGLPPVWLDRANATNKSGCTLIDYFYLCGRKEGKYQHLNRKSASKTVIADICKHFDIPNYYSVKKKSDEDEDELESVLEKVRYSFVNDAPIYIKKAKWSGSDLYLYYCFQGGVWRLAESFKTVYSECIQYFIDCPKNLLLHKKVKGVVQNLLEYSDNLQHIESKLDFDKLRIKEIIPLANGDYDTRTRKLTTTYSPGICNMTRSGISFREVDDRSKGVVLFNYWLSKQYQLPEQEMVKAWLILNCLGRAIETKRMLNIYGTPGTGKTVLLNILKSALGNLALEVNTQNFLLDGNRFASQRSDGIYALLLDEFETGSSGWSKLKNLSGNGAKTIEIERKGLTPYDSLFFAGITTATQDRFFIPNSDDGGIRRRIVPLKHTPNMYREEFQDIDLQFAKPEIYEDIFIWAIQQDGDKALKTFTDYAKTIGKTNIREVVLDNDKVLMFMNECLKFTNCESDDLSNIQLQEAYKSWLYEIYGESLEQNKLAKISQYVKEKASIPDNKIDWKFIPQKGQEVKVKRGDRYVKGFKGIKFNPEAVTDMSGFGHP